MKRKAEISRKTKETDIVARLNLDGKGIVKIDTQMGFFDHMLNALFKHALFDVTIKARGDLHVDFHHTVEDVGLVLGEILAKALGDKKGINRFGYGVVPMDEALAKVAIDLSGRPHLEYRVKCKRRKIGDFDLSLCYEFFNAFAQTGLFTMHIQLDYGQNPHHIYESIFKALGRALCAASAINPKRKDVPSTKGKL